MILAEYEGTMFGETWRTSARQFNVIVERNVAITLSDGVTLRCEIFRPDSDDKFPAILGYHPYDAISQTGPITPTAITATAWISKQQERTNAALEAGDPYFFARRGYVHVLCNIRGTGQSGGLFNFASDREVQDLYEIIENWLPGQRWCDGNVTMFGVSYFAVSQLQVAALNPPHLKCIFAPWAITDWYRDQIYRGGILCWGFPVGWAMTSMRYANGRPENVSLARMGEAAYLAAVSELKKNADLMTAAPLAAAISDPKQGTHSFIVDMLLHPTFDEFWRERTPALSVEKIKVPAYIGADWSNYGLHLRGAFRTWEALKGPKRMLIGPPVYLDRPTYQLQYEALRWYDYWIKGVDTGVMSGPPISLFLMGTGGWKHADKWPLPGTRWTPFFLHEKGLLSERDHWPREGSDSYNDSPWGRESLVYSTPALVEDTEVVGPIVAKLYGSATTENIFWILSLYEVDAEGQRRLLTKGWQKGSHRELDEKRAKPWEPVYTHAREEPLAPNEIHEFYISLAPTGNLFKAGSRIELKISSVDDEPTNPMELIGCGTLKSQSINRITVFHDSEHPSCIWLPITSGNLMGTYMSGGKWIARG